MTEAADGFYLIGPIATPTTSSPITSQPPPAQPASSPLSTSISLPSDATKSVQTEDGGSPVVRKGGRGVLVEREKEATIDMLPDEVLLQVFGRLSFTRTQFFLKQVCRRWAVISNDKHLACCRRINLQTLVMGPPSSGKTTLVGHLLYATGVINAHGLVNTSKKVAEIASTSQVKTRSMLIAHLDKTKEERAKAKSLHARWHHLPTGWAGCSITLIDAPGSQNLSERLAIGALQCHCAILTVAAGSLVGDDWNCDAPAFSECLRVIQFSGVPRVVIVVTKLDCVVGMNPRKAFHATRKQALGLIGERSPLADVQFIPFLYDNFSTLYDLSPRPENKDTTFPTPSALLSGRLEPLPNPPLRQSQPPAWYNGPVLMQVLSTFFMKRLMNFKLDINRKAKQPLRVCIDHVYPSIPNLGLCVTAFVKSGTLVPGQAIKVMPLMTGSWQGRPVPEPAAKPMKRGGATSTKPSPAASTAGKGPESTSTVPTLDSVKVVVHSIQMHYLDIPVAYPGYWVGIQLRCHGPGKKMVMDLLKKKVERGMVLTPASEGSLRVSSFVARVLVAGVVHFRAGSTTLLHCHSGSVSVRINQIKYRINKSNGEVLEVSPKELKPGDAGILEATPETPFAAEPYENTSGGTKRLSDLGRILLRDNNRTAAKGIILSCEYAD